MYVKRFKIVKFKMKRLGVDFFFFLKYIRYIIIFLIILIIIRNVRNMVIGRKSIVVLLFNFISKVLVFGVDRFI